MKITKCEYCYWSDLDYYKTPNEYFCVNIMAPKAEITKNQYFKRKPAWCPLRKNKKEG